MSEKEGRTIKLRCPPLSRTVTIAARDEQRVDLGSIARAFGLDPQTLKLNGHFVSRGADLVSPSVTWRSLLSFFSSKGLPTGVDGGDALVVDGKLLRIGSKRGHDPEGAIGRPKQDENCSGQSRRQSEEVHMSRTTKRSKIGDSDRRCHSFSVIGNGLGSKRKHVSEEVSLLKRLKINDASSDFESFACRHMGENLKRLGDDGRGVTYASSKRQAFSNTRERAVSLHDLVIIPEDLVRVEIGCRIEPEKNPLFPTADSICKHIGLQQDGLTLPVAQEFEVNLVMPILVESQLPISKNIS